VEYVKSSHLVTNLAGPKLCIIATSHLAYHNLFVQLQKIVDP
jgi:hypothetical protein